MIQSLQLALRERLNWIANIPGRTDSHLMRSANVADYPQLYARCTHTISLQPHLGQG
jgi:hypothetical protein